VAFFRDFFINIPKIYAFLFYKNIKYLKLNQKILIILIVNLNTVYLWGFPRFIINNAFIVTNAILNIIRKSPNKLEFSFIIKFIKINFFEDTINNYESSLYK
jgi:hypothetical protein